MEEKQNSVKQPKLLILQEQGTPRFSQALFLLPKSGKTEEASEFPLEGLCTVLLCVQAASIERAKVGNRITIALLFQARSLLSRRQTVIGVYQLAACW